MISRTDLFLCFPWRYCKHVCVCVCVCELMGIGSRERPAVIRKDNYRRIL